MLLKLHPKPTIFIDDNFLDDLTDQLSLKYEDKFETERQIEISLTPKVIFKRKSVREELSKSEKINRLLSHLSNLQMVMNVRPGSYNSIKKMAYKKEYVIEVCFATRIFIPNKFDCENNIKGLNIWISLNSIDQQYHYDYPPGMLCLLENYYHGKTNFSISGFTLLNALIFGSRNHGVENTMLNNILNISFEEQRNSRPGMKPRHILFYNTWWIKEFMKDPLYFFKNIVGCVMSEERKIEVLYYIRAFGPEEYDNRQTTSIFGYPIFIKAA